MTEKNTRKANKIPLRTKEIAELRKSSKLCMENNPESRRIWRNSEIKLPRPPSTYRVRGE
jgi:hypothetical protein